MFVQDTRKKLERSVFNRAYILFRDIAARNCLIEPSSLRVRLADTALARDLFPQDYHCLGDNENRPIRWMALETLQHNQYSTATDVVRIMKRCRYLYNLKIFKLLLKIINKVLYILLALNVITVRDIIVLFSVLFYFGFKYTRFIHIQ